MMMAYDDDGGDDCDDVDDGGGEFLKTKQGYLYIYRIIIIS